jgi:hypothetical protein
MRDAAEEREEALDEAEARISWRSRVLIRVVGGMREWVPKPVQFVVDKLQAGEDPVGERTPDAFPEAWSIPKGQESKRLQETLDGMTNAALSACFSATQDAYLLTEDDAELQATFARGLKTVVFEAGQRGLDLESGKHDPKAAKNKSRATLHTDTPPDPVRVKRRIRERQLVR